MVTLPGSRTLTKRSANWMVDRDPVSGHRIPTFTESDIEGTLTERGGDMPAFAPGVVMTQDAIFYTLDQTLMVLDQISDGGNIFAVAEIEEKKDGDDVLVYRACHLRRLELYKEG